LEVEGVGGAVVMVKLLGMLTDDDVVSGASDETTLDTALVTLDAEVATAVA
jgi:hypothetical protein